MKGVKWQRRGRFSAKSLTEQLARNRTNIRFCE
jgi:hypothetical protein